MPESVEESKLECAGLFQYRVIEKASGKLIALFCFENDARDFMVHILPRECTLK